MSEPSMLKMTSACYVMPTPEASKQDERLQIVGRTVIYSDPRNVKELKHEYNFDVVFNTPHDFSRSSYNSIVAPLVKRAINGEDSLLIIGGSNAQSFQQYLLSQPSMHGLVSQTSSQLLQSINNSTEKAGSVTFAWYRVQNGNGDGLSDVLQDATGRAPPSPASASAAALTLRDNGRGRMVSPQGLLELEIAAGGDVETVLSHVLNSQGTPTSRTAAVPHNVMQLSLHRPAAPNQGCVTFLILGSLGTWTQNLRDVMQAIEARKAGPPFHKHRLTLLLREALMKRLAASSLLLLSAETEIQTQNLGWLGLWGGLSEKAASHSLSVSRAIRSASTGRLLANPDSRDSRDPREFGQPPLKSAPQRSQHTNYSASHHGNANNLTPQPHSGGAPQPLTNHNHHNLNRGLSALHLDRNSSLGNDPRDNRDNASLTPSTAPPDRNDRSDRNTAFGGGSTAHSPSLYLADDQLESTAALTLALEAARNEAAALRVAYSYATDRQREAQSALEALTAQLAEEGGALRDRDRQRYRRAMTDLRDYAVYKEVMETALLRLQSELQIVAAENTALKAGKANEERTSQRQRAASDKYSKDLITTKRKVTDLETKMAALEKQLKAAQKEKEAAVAALAAQQTSLGGRVAQLQETVAIRSRDLEESNRKRSILEERCRLLDGEKEALLQSSTQESAQLRAAHAKALETLMGYQEENDALRGAVLELTNMGSRQTVEGMITANSRTGSRRPSTVAQPIPPPPPPAGSPLVNHGRPGILVKNAIAPAPASSSSSSSAAPAGLNGDAIQRKLSSSNLAAAQHMLSGSESGSVGGKSEGTHWSADDI